MAHTFPVSGGWVDLGQDGAFCLQCIVGPLVLQVRRVSHQWWDYRVAFTPGRPDVGREELHSPQNYTSAEQARAACEQCAVEYLRGLQLQIGPPPGEYMECTRAEALAAGASCAVIVDDGDGEDPRAEVSLLADALQVVQDLAGAHGLEVRAFSVIPAGDRKEGARPGHLLMADLR